MNKIKLNITGISYDFVRTDPGWFIYQLEDRIGFRSSAAWPKISCTWAFPLFILVLYGELIPSSFLNWISPLGGLTEDLLYRVLKWWRHKNEISEIMGFVRIFWKDNVQEAYLPKMSISGHFGHWNRLWDVRRLYSENSIYTNPSNFFWVDPKKI